jgi:hypothetical protein
MLAKEDFAKKMGGRALPFSGARLMVDKGDQRHFEGQGMYG